MDIAQERLCPPCAALDEAGQVCPVGQTVIARSDSDEAIHFSAGGAVDCFASLAMTTLDTLARQIDPSGKSVLATKSCPVLSAKIFRLTCRANQSYQLAPSRPARGALRNVTNVGRDAVDVAALARRWNRSAACRERSTGAQTNGADADGEVVWS